MKQESQASICRSLPNFFVAGFCSQSSHSGHLGYSLSPLLSLLLRAPVILVSLGPKLNVSPSPRPALLSGALVRSCTPLGVSPSREATRPGYGDGVRVRVRVTTGLLRALPRAWVSGNSRSMNADAVVLRPRMGGPVSRVPDCGLSASRYRDGGREWAPAGMMVSPSRKWTWRKWMGGRCSWERDWE